MMEPDAAAVSAFGLLATRPMLAALLTAGPTPGRVRAALPALAVVAGAAGAQSLVSAAAGYCQARLQPLVSREAQQRLYDLTSRVPLAAFDDPGFADEMRRSRDRTVFAAARLVDATVNLSTGLVHLVAGAAALLLLQPVLLPALHRAGRRERLRQVDAGQAAGHAARADRRGAALERPAGRSTAPARTATAPTSPSSRGTTPAGR
jgi:ATP-binding cassette subfamily B protein/ATP-binding cassette subfamily C protein